MADYRGKKKEHAFNLISKDVKGGLIQKPLLFYGKERFLIDWAVALIIDNMVDSSCKELDLSILEEENVSLDEIKVTCETFPMLSRKRVVVVKNFKGLSNENFITYLADIPETCQLVLLSEELDKRLKSYKELIKYCQEYEFGTLDEADIKKYIEKRFRASGKSIKNSLISQLIHSTGYFDKDSDYTLYNLENDIKKIIAHCIGDEIQLEDMASTISGNVEINVYDMIDAISGNNKDEAFHLLHNIMTSGEKLYYILAVIIGQFETILDVKELRGEGHGLQEMQKILGIHEFRIKKAMGYAEKFSENNIRKTLISLYEVDRNIKNGFIDGALALEIIIARI